jgi:hypothetical protein
MPSFEMSFLSGLILMCLCPYKDINIKSDKNGISKEGIKTSISNLIRMASQKRA